MKTQSHTGKVETGKAQSHIGKVETGKFKEKERKLKHRTGRGTQKKRNRLENNNKIHLPIKLVIKLLTKI
mgnify:CR=1 FL=1